MPAVPATMPAVPATMPAVPATMPAVPATGVSLACHRQARDRDCHAADHATKFHEGMSHKEIQAQPPAALRGMREATVRVARFKFPNPQRRMEFAPCPHRSEVIDLSKDHGARRAGQDSHGQGH
jgi:hypothetical protein